MQLNHAARRRLDQAINKAAEDIHAAHFAYTQQRLNMAQAVRLNSAHRSIAELRAFFEDRQYGVVDDYMLYLLETYEDMASSLIEALEATADCRDGRLDECEKSQLGDRYVVARTIHVRNREYRQAEVVVNPAVGFAKLDAWEEKLRATLQRRKSAA